MNHRFRIHSFVALISAQHTNMPYLWNTGVCLLLFKRYLFILLHVYSQSKEKNGVYQIKHAKSWSQICHQQLFIMKFPSFVFIKFTWIRFIEVIFNSIQTAWTRQVSPVLNRFMKNIPFLLFTFEIAEAEYCFYIFKITLRLGYRQFDDIYIHCTTSFSNISVKLLQNVWEQIKILRYGAI